MRIHLPFCVGDGLACLCLYNLKVENMGLVCKIGMKRCYLLIDIAWVGWRLADDERAEASCSQLDTTDRVLMRCRADEQL